MNNNIVYKSKWVYNWFSNMEPDPIPLREEGWTLKTHSERCWSVWHSLHKYITQY